MSPEAAYVNPSLGPCRTSEAAASDDRTFMKSFACRSVQLATVTKRSTRQTRSALFEGHSISPLESRRLLTLSV